jgi:hypothetical protein
VNAKPTTQQLIDAVCVELASKIAPAISDPTATVQLDMALAILRTAAVRSGNEHAWRKEESDAIEAAANRLMAQLPDASGLAASLRAYAEGRTGGLGLDEAVADYHLASEVLSCAIEAAYESGDEGHIAVVGALIDQRHDNQQKVTGQFMALGRE